jgi:hypothetical protein
MTLRHRAQSTGPRRHGLLSGLTFYRDVLSRRGRQRVEQFGREPLAGLPILQSEDATGDSIAFQQTRGCPLHPDAILVPTVEAQPGDVRGAIVVAFHRRHATPVATE